MQQGFFDNRLEKKSCKPLDIQVFSTTKWKKNAPKWRLIILRKQYEWRADQSEAERTGNKRCANRRQQKRAHLSVSPSRPPSRADFVW
jgi:hypothetical protein